MNQDFNITEATLKMKIDAEDIVAHLERDKKYKGCTFIFEHNGKRYNLTLSRARENQ